MPQPKTLYSTPANASAGSDGILEPSAELGRVVGRLAVVGRGDDDHAALLRQRADVVVERPDRGHEPAVGRILGDGVGEALGGAQIGAIQHQQRRVVRSRAGHRRRQRAGAPRARVRCRERRSGRAPGPRLDPDLEVVGLDRERLLGFELVVGEVDELEPLQEHAQHEGGLLQRELPADAGALPGAEGLVGVRRDLGSGSRG